MRAKFLRKEKSKYWGYDYYFECIDCGEEYTRERYDDRTTPYCGACWRKHSLERKKIREKQKKQAEINEVLDKIRAEILEEKECAYADFERYKVEYLGQDWEDVIDSLPQDDFRYGMERCIEIIDEYKIESEE